LQKSDAFGFQEEVANRNGISDQIKFLFVWFYSRERPNHSYEFLTGEVVLLEKFMSSIFENQNQEKIQTR